MSIGDTLAEARRQSGLTVTQVSQQTRIRETIVRGIERGDFSACGGDFYARGHIRSIARAVGLDPDALVAEYDAAHGAPHSIRAAEVFEPSTPIRLKEPRRRFNWTAAMVLALAVIVGYVIYHTVSSGSGTKHPAASQQHPAAHHSPAAHTSPSAHSTPPPASKHLVIKLVVKSMPCWVEFTRKTGAYLFQVTLPPGATRTWRFKHAVNMQLGNPGAVVLTVNGQNRGSPGTVGNPVTLSFHPGKQISG